MSLSPVTGTEVPEAANGVATHISAEPHSENGPHTPLPLKYGGSRVPCPVEGSDEGSLSDTENNVDVERRVYDGEGHLDVETDFNLSSKLDSQLHVKSLHASGALDPSLPTATCTGDSESGPKDTKLSEASDTVTAPGEALPGNSTQHTDSKDSSQRGRPAGADRQQTQTESQEALEEDGEKEKQDEEEDEKMERECGKQHAGGGTDMEWTFSRHYSSSAPDYSSASSSSPPPPLLPSDSSPCPPHIMAQVRVRNVPERDRIVRGMQDSKSLDEISQACGGGSGARGGGRGGQSEGRRATISSALELEGTVSHDGDLTHFITKNLEQKIKMSSKPSLDCSDSDCSGPIHRSRGSSRRPADIPPIDPAVLVDLQRHTQEVAHSVEMMMRSLNGTIQNMTALSVGYIQTYRDSVDSLGESVDMSIKGMYTLMARCEELDRSMQPIHTLAAQIRDIKRTLDALEAICK
ncbi:BLOC-1-related complex subunit 6 [Myripristis murdjan]|uniref:BLOC-1 related complex subunit 6 n=1 Tax=Myripristis murdjan TaxID=586833 RepID=A0A667WNX6_9TELE|nr:BLOC-1-related complex subunit 6 [Myripristis murdjan]